MEGTFTTDDHLLLTQAGIDPNDDGATREVMNDVRALDEAFSMLKELPMSRRVIRRAHEILLSGLPTGRGAEKKPGEYRREQNWIGGLTIDVARYVPPPPSEALRCMDMLEAYVNRESGGFPTPLMDLALVHYQVEAIRPFADGNGRVGRMLISLTAVHSGLLDTPVLYVSPVMEHHKDNDVNLMFDVSARGRWSEWLRFFTRIAESCREAIDAIDRLLQVQAELREGARTAGRSGSPMMPVDFLFEKPVISANDAAQRLGVTCAAANNAVGKLLDLGILHVAPNTWPRLHVSLPIQQASRPSNRSAAGPIMISVAG